MTCRDDLRSQVDDTCVLNLEVVGPSFRLHTQHAVHFDFLGGLSGRRLLVEVVHALFSRLPQGIALDNDHGAVRVCEEFEFPGVQ